jgi:ferritin-like metal-binding protein YciE
MVTDTKSTTFSGGESASEKNQKTIADYVGDMHALESHIEEALDRQLNMFDDLPDVRAAVRGYHDFVKGQRDALAELLKDLPKESTGSSIKEMGSTLLGKAAGLIDKIRTEGNSKVLRDDYTAFNLAAVSYSMLFTTATALGNSSVAEVAERHLRGYAKAVQEINHLIPEAVLKELEKDGHQVKSGVVASTIETVDRIWKKTAK